MRLTVILIRHAKSDWGDPALTDHDRPLNERGRRDATRIGAWMAARGVRPGAALISSAVRAQQTWALIAGTLPDPVAQTTLPGLYHAAPETILASLRASPADCVALVGHNPGIGAAARRLAQRSPDHPRFADYPTAATALFGVETADPSALRWGAGRLTAFVTPHDL